jgi:uncharacterized cupin superfamily protein
MAKRLKLIFLLTVTLMSPISQADSSILPLRTESLMTEAVQALPPWPASMLISGESAHGQKVLHEGEFVVVIYESVPAVIGINEPYPYDEFVRVLEGTVVLTSDSGDRQVYGPNDHFLVPKGWMGTWDMPSPFRELIIVETASWNQSESSIASTFDSKRSAGEADPEVLPLLVNALREDTLEALPPWPEGVVVAGVNKHAQKVLHEGEVVAALYGAEAARLTVAAPFPYDEYVLVLKGQVALTSDDGSSQTFGVGDGFLVPKGWTGTWDMPEQYLEKIVVESAAWNEAEG